jgi:hypothetical protein
LHYLHLLLQSRRNKFFLSKGKLQVAASANYRSVRWILGFA